MSTKMPFHGFVSVSSRGLIALPKAVRERYRLDDPGAQVEITERTDGVLELRPTAAIPATQAWFWKADWQEGEREVDDHLKAGNIAVSEGVENFLEDLPKTDTQGE
jgi:bifunctional DNA-binding transcriptional regulator/antitoxin component of YhaV-PrlF toxin-antitoxin module